MTFTFPPGAFTVPFDASPVKADGSPSGAVLSNVAFVASDPVVFTVAPDPANPNGGILTSGPAGGTAILTGTATATEADGTVNGITGAVTIVVSEVPQGPAAALAFKFGDVVPPVNPPTPPANQSKRNNR